MAFQPFASAFDTMQRGQGSGDAGQSFPQAPQEYGLPRATMAQPPASPVQQARQVYDSVPQPVEGQGGLEPVIADLLQRVAQLTARVNALEVAVKQDRGDDRDMGLKVISSPMLQEGEIP
jgi:hypothetical protein